MRVLLEISGSNAKLVCLKCLTMTTSLKLNEFKMNLSGIKANYIFIFSINYVNILGPEMLVGYVTSL